MSWSRRVLHVVTVAACLVGGAVAVLPADDRVSTRVAASSAHARATADASTTTTFPVESFVPAAGPDTFEITPVPPRITVPPTPPPAPAPSTASPSPASVNRAADAPSPSIGVAQVERDGQLVARLSKVTAVYDTPGVARASIALSATTELGTPRVLPVVRQGGDWLLVELPTRPNGSTGWIRTRDARLDTVADRVDVDLATRILVWSRNGVVQLVAPVAVGAPASPTPAGAAFVTDVLPSSAGSAYGAWVIALDTHSDAFTEFEGGDPRIAIHGTNDPSSIGRAASFGCVRVGDDALAVLAGALAPGTPVTVH